MEKIELTYNEFDYDKSCAFTLDKKFNEDDMQKAFDLIIEPEMRRRKKEGLESNDFYENKDEWIVLTKRTNCSFDKNRWLYEFRIIDKRTKKDRI